MRTSLGTPRAGALLFWRGPASTLALANSTGLVVYQMKPDGTLEGLWTIADQGGVGTKVLTPMN